MNPDCIVSRLVEMAEARAAVTRDTSAAITVIESGNKHVFKDCKSAALFLLLLDQTSLHDFVTWANQERNSVLLHAPSHVKADETWKYMLLQDFSLDSAVVPVLACSSTTAGSASSEEQRMLGLGMDNECNTATLICDSQFPIRPKVGLDPPKPKRARTTDLLPGSENEPRNGPTRSRGSTRRLPELEGLIVCPDCGRKGQSIFDPNNSTRDGVVWQYFYCRNVECVRGRSASRYIGWTTRRKG
eukprot:Blabericola_migrator_1__9762@NODE_534_length_7780_cov_272_866459_g407_i0_p4_GENE_NODE_534_length_7780_cov_272_866459_g407_i0NODE_534_length_7780_cov_272_866459_g407_i0_p4_ORF_typecomplete_len244_score13_21Zn_ribbon_recom/PF13408_6/0_021Ogr_Delta/PF04606_12/0_37_NODE_534_length_7780_cov_272_866459_g407_i044765207